MNKLRHNEHIATRHFSMQKMNKHIISLTSFFFFFHWRGWGVGICMTQQMECQITTERSNCNKPSGFEYTPEVRLSLLKALNIYKSPGKHDFNA